MTEAPARLVATTVLDMVRTVSIEPLPVGDPRYADVAPGRDDRGLRMMQARLEDFLLGLQDGGFAKLTLTGHRGSGKTTELLRLEKDVEDTAFPVHLYLDEKLRDGFDYSLMLLWLANSLAEHFEQQGMPLDDRYIDDIGDWFATVTETREEIVAMSAEAKARTEARAGGSVLGFGMKALAALKSRIVGNTEERVRIQRILQRRSSELVERINDLLLHAQQVLDKRRGGRKLLIVQDNLDRLPAAPAADLFIGHGDLLRELRVHLVLTVPIGLTLAPHRIGGVFPDSFSLPMPKVETRDGADFEPGIDSLVGLIGRRVDLDRVFGTRAAVRTLVKASGGSFRDLMRLLSQARLAARADGAATIDAGHVDDACRTLRLDFERILIPSRTYFGLLAAVHRHKRDPFDTNEDAPAAAKDREFLRELIANGAVLEHNGQEVWSDVHPVLRDSPAFQEALSRS